MDLNDLYNEGDDAEKWTPTLNAEIAGIITAIKEVDSKFGGKVRIATIKQNEPDTDGHLYRAVFINKAIGKALALAARKSGMTKILPGDITALRVVDGEEYEPSKWSYSYEADLSEGDREAYAEPADPFADAFGSH
jgi:hypothetical protein